MRPLHVQEGIISHELLGFELTQEDFDFYDLWEMFGKPPLRRDFEDSPAPEVQSLAAVNRALGLGNHLVNKRAAASQEAKDRERIASGITDAMVDFKSNAR